MSNIFLEIIIKDSYIKLKLANFVMFMKYSYTEAGSEVQQSFFLPDTL